MCAVARRKPGNAVIHSVKCVRELSENERRLVSATLLRCPVPLQLHAVSRSSSTFSATCARASSAQSAGRLWFWRIPRNQGSYEMQCQGCGTMQRQRRTILFLRQTGLGDSVSPVRVLHLAPDAPIQAELQNMPNVETVTGDLLTGDVDITLDVTAMDLPDESFDVIICSHVLEHVLDDRAAMSEMRRVLKSDGWALINVPSDPNRAASFEDATITSAEDRLAAFGQEDHVRIYSHGDLLQRFADAGFDVQVDPLLVSTEERRRYVLSGDGSWEHGYFCKKSNRTAAPAD